MVRRNSKYGFAFKSFWYREFFQPGLISDLEPSYIIKEKATVFFSNKRYSDKQVEDITEALLNYGTTGEDSSSKIQEMIRKSASGDVYNKTRLYENSSRRGSVNSDASQDSDSLKVTTSASPFSKFDFITEPQNSKVKNCVLE